VLGELPDDVLTLVEIPALAISSTDCRLRAKEGRPLWYLMPDGVVQYVSKRRLYRADLTARPTTLSRSGGDDT